MRVFPILIKKRFSKKGKISECAGLWADMTDEQFEGMEKTIKKSREYTRSHVIERIK